MIDRLKEMYLKNKEMILYLFFGGLAFIVSIGTYGLFSEICHMNVLIANIISWVITVMFAFVTNRIWVFESPTETIIELCYQMFKFYTGRVITLVIEEVILIIFITWLGFDSMIIKVIAQVVVIVLNYIISKLIIFKK